MPEDPHRDGAETRKLVEELRQDIRAANLPEAPSIRHILNLMKLWAASENSEDQVFGLAEAWLKKLRGSGQNGDSLVAVIDKMRAKYENLFPI